uniref:Histone domain-containing protein n=1 Tax=Angiostrongylus cantonensis TaxID=6313 RepID=A0A0K0D036_ANGCA
MVRVKPLPERALVEGRVTMRETTREIIHEVSVGEQYSHQQHESNSYYVGPNEYMTDEQDYARLPGNQSKQYVHQQHNSNSYNYAGPSEYTTNEQDYSRLLGNRRFIIYRIIALKTTGFNTAIVRSPAQHDSKGRVKSRIDRRISGEDRFTEGLIGQNSGSNGPNLGNRESSVYDRPFQRIVQEVVRDLYPKEEYRFSAGALEALQEISEAFIVEVFDSTCTCAAHANRVTVMPNDLHLLRMLQRW